MSQSEWNRASQQRKRDAGMVRVERWIHESRRDEFNEAVKAFKEPKAMGDSKMDTDQFRAYLGRRRVQVVLGLKKEARSLIDMIDYALSDKAYAPEGGVDWQYYLDSAGGNLKNLEDVVYVLEEAGGDLSSFEEENEHLMNLKGKYKELYKSLVNGDLIK